MRGADSSKSDAPYSRTSRPTAEKDGAGGADALQKVTLVATENTLLGVPRLLRLQKHKDGCAKFLNASNYQLH